jgi:hypothetical protein
MIGLAREDNALLAAVPLEFFGIARQRRSAI